eukprot:XP_001610235.1 phenylalanine-tRNA ligase [Babesia bovis T2Bo]
MGRRLDIDLRNPVGQTAELIKQFFREQVEENESPGSHYGYIACDNEPVTIRDNFDELQVPLDHVSRKPCDNYYVSEDYVHNFDRHVMESYPSILSDAPTGTYCNKIINRIAEELGHSVYKVLPTHATSHLPNILRNGIRRAIYSGQVFRRDTIDSQHYPVFHQMDGVKIFTRSELQRIKRQHGDSSLLLSDDAVILSHLKSTLEKLIRHLFRNVAKPVGDTERRCFEELNLYTASDDWMMWDADTSFPFTDPSLELHVKQDGKWVEILGCGKLKNIIIDNILKKHFVVNDTTDLNEDIVGGWAFGLGLERLAMVLCNITDIRQFWEDDERFMRQYSTFSQDGKLRIFKPYSKNPPVSRDISFYLDGPNYTKGKFDEYQFRHIFEELSRDYVEDITLLSQYTHPETGRKSLCYRVIYRAMGENLTNAFVNDIHQRALNKMLDLFNIELR